MARITVEDCLQKVNNRFALIHMASKRVRQLRKGAEPKITSKNRDIVVSLREIAAGNVIGIGPGDYEMLPEGTVDSIQEETASEMEEVTEDE
jgi:DNA-directed RNA polymerase subunit omega